MQDLKQVMAMRRRQDRFRGSGRLGLLGVSAFALLTGCGWFDSSTPTGTPPRPGADRQVAPSASLPAATGGGQYDAGIAPVEASTPQIGSVVPGKGGQKAQKEAAEKEAAERDAKEREEREAARKAAEEGGPAAAPTGAPGGEIPTIPAAQPSVPAPAPVTPTMPPPASAAPAPLPPPAPAPEPGQASPVPDKPS